MREKSLNVRSLTQLGVPAFARRQLLILESLASNFAESKILLQKG